MLVEGADPRSSCLTLEHSGAPRSASPVSQGAYGTLTCHGQLFTSLSFEQPGSGAATSPDRHTESSRPYVDVDLAAFHFS